MKDKINTSTIGGIRIPEMKGRVDIKLFNAETGELEQEAHGENMVTNAIKTIFASNYFGAINYMQLMPIATHLLGGVLCFENPQTEDADNMYIPNNNAIIAHAGQSNETYDTTNDSTRGTVNSFYSGIVTDGYKHVWDFASTQGNGTISSLSLTHEDFGDYAFVSKYLTNNVLNWYCPSFEPFTYNSLNDNDNNKWVLGVWSSNTARVPILYDLVDNIAYNLNGNRTTLTILERKSYGVMDKIGLNELSPVADVTPDMFNVSHTLTMPYDAAKMRYLLRKISASEYDDKATYAQGAKVYHNGKLYKANTAISTAEAWNESHWDLQVCYDMHALYPTGNTIHRRIINLTDFTMTSSDMTVLNASMLPPDALNPNGDCYPISIDQDGYIYIAGENKKVYKVKYTNPADVSDYTWESRSDLSDSDVYEALRNNLHGIGHLGVSAAAGMVFTSNSVIQCKMHGRFDWTWNGITHNVFSEIDNQLVFLSPLTNSTLASGSAVANVFNKLYLGTIYNLNSPITKLSSQTMQITYTITEVEPEEET